MGGLDAAGAARAQAEAREEEQPEPEDEREGDSDRRVIGRQRHAATTPAQRGTSEHTDAGAHDHRGEHEPEALIHAGGGRRQRTRKGDVAERIAGEHLATQDHEPPADAAGQRHEGPRQQGVAHEFLGEHQAITPSTGIGSAGRARRTPSSAAPARTST